MGVFVARVLILLSVLHVLYLVLLLLLGVRQVLVCMVLPRYRRRLPPAAMLLLKMLSVHCTVPCRGSRSGRPPPDRRALVRRRPVVVIIGGQEMSFLRPGTGSSCCAGAAAGRPLLMLAWLTLSVAGPVCRRSHVVGRGEITAAVAFYASCSTKPSLQPLTNFEFNFCVGVMLAALNEKGIFE